VVIAVAIFLNSVQNMIKSIKHTFDHITRRQSANHGPECAYCAESIRHEPVSVADLSMHQPSTRIKRYGCFVDDQSDLVAAMNIKFHTTNLNDVTTVAKAMQTNDCLVVVCHDLEWLYELSTEKLVWIWVLTDLETVEMPIVEHVTVVTTNDLAGTVQQVIVKRGRITLQQLQDQGCRITATRKSDLNKTYFGF